ncbi:MAG: hypothetical protein WBZ42_10870 [Halobacteriota archaeon]
MAQNIEEQDDYEFPLQEADLADPLMHVHHHEMCLKDRERHDDDIEELREAMVEQLKRVEELERSVNMLATLFNWNQLTVHDEVQVGI